MDALSDLLRVVRLDGAYFYPVEAAGPWSVVSARASELAPRILPGAEHLISYHILIRGCCFAGLAGAVMTPHSNDRPGSSHDCWKRHLLRPARHIR